MEVNDHLVGGGGGRGVLEGGEGVVGSEGGLGGGGGQCDRGLVGYRRTMEVLEGI